MTTLSPISNQSATVSAIISTIEDLTQYSSTDFESKIGQAYSRMCFDFFNEKETDPALIDDDRQDDVNQMQAQKALSLIFRDIADKSGRPEDLMAKAEYYEAQYSEMFNVIRLSIDTDESGTIDDDEETLRDEQRFIL